MKKTIVINKTPVDIFILDKPTSNEVTYCIPKNLTYTILEIRNSIIIIFNFKFIFYFITFFLKTKKIMLSSVMAAIMIKKVRLLITFTDTIDIFSIIDNLLPNIHKIVIQNGSRTNQDYHAWNKIRYFPILFCFGEYEKLLISNMGGKIDLAIAAGSLRYGIFKKNYSNLTFNNDIIFISQWRNDYINYKEGNVEIFENKKILLPLLLSYSKRLNKNFKILLSTSDSDSSNSEEKFFFKKIMNIDNDMIFINKKTFVDAYQCCENAELIVSYDSTLLFEMYGAGKKAIFLGSQPKIMKKIGWDLLCDKLVDCVKIQDYKNENDFINKLTYLLDLNQNEYLELTNFSRNYYMSFQNNFPQIEIQNKIKNLLKYE
tara:strand:- start:7492 stop:8610 length:1119 start_codon:yes stop_codon:yes gene_type:complete